MKIFWKYYQLKRNHITMTTLSSINKLKGSKVNSNKWIETNRFCLKKNLKNRKIHQILKITPWVKSIIKDQNCYKNRTINSIPFSPNSKPKTTNTNKKSLSSMKRINDSYKGFWNKLQKSNNWQNIIWNSSFSYKNFKKSFSLCKSR